MEYVLCITMSEASIELVINHRNDTIQEKDCSISSDAVPRECQCEMTCVLNQLPPFQTDDCCLKSGCHCGRIAATPICERRCETDHGYFADSVTNSASEQNGALVLTLSLLSAVFHFA
jgi:hypothetical protein